MRDETAFFKSFEESESTFFCGERVDGSGSEKSKSAASGFVEIADDACHAPRVFECEQIPFDAVGHADEEEHRNSALFQLAIGVEVRNSGVCVKNDPGWFPCDGGGYDALLSGGVARERDDGGKIVCRACRKTECFEAVGEKDNVVAEEDEFFCDDFRASRDDASDAVLFDDDPAHCEFGERSAQGRFADAELFREFLFRWQFSSFGQESELFFEFPEQSLVNISASHDPLLVF